jgi:hypothetical protein
MATCCWRRAGPATIAGWRRCRIWRRAHRRRRSRSCLLSDSSGAPGPFRRADHCPFASRAVVRRISVPAVSAGRAARRTSSDDRCFDAAPRRAGRPLASGGTERAEQAPPTSRHPLPLRLAKRQRRRRDVCVEPRRLVVRRGGAVAGPPRRGGRLSSMSLASRRIGTVPAPRGERQAAAFADRTVGG